jgi:sugar lactone lactonase YvrE
MHGAEVLVFGLDHPEGVCWDPRAESVYAGGEDGQLYRVRLDGSWEEVARAPRFVLGVAVDGRGRVVMCCQQAGVHVWDPTDSAVRPVANGFTFANYPAFGPAGTLYVSDSGTWRKGDGRIVSIGVDGSVEEVTREPCDFTNGLAVSPDGRSLWVAESHTPRVSRIDLETGALDVVLWLDNTVPDGLAFDAGGGVLVSCYRPDRIYHVDAEGVLRVAADDFQGTTLGAPTNVCYVGRDLDRVVSANFGRWHLTLLDLGLRGAPLHRPDRWAVDA